MSWMGKIVGGTMGMMLGGPIGAILGVVVGHHVIDGGAMAQRLSGLEEKQSVYFFATFSMLAKLAKADGLVTREEIAVIEKVMRDSLRLNSDARALAIEIFNEARDADSSFEGFAQQFHDYFKDSPQIQASLVELLLVVGCADGQLHRAEEELILQAVAIFGLQNQYEQIRSRVTGQPGDIDRYYQILGCSKGDSAAAVKRSYRKLAMEYHPDRMQARGIPEEFAQVSEDRFKEIQNAYDIVSKDLSV